LPRDPLREHDDLVVREHDDLVIEVSRLARTFGSRGF
jgi:hypothetical protein